MSTTTHTEFGAIFEQKMSFLEQNYRAARQSTLQHTAAEGFFLCTFVSDCVFRMCVSMPLTTACETTRDK